MKHFMIRLIRLYQKFISPLKPPSCRFTPTCSAYAIEAFQKRGFFAGFILMSWRILRCNPFCKGGYDPVPDKGFRRVRDVRICEDMQSVSDLSRIDQETDTTPQKQTEKGNKK